MQLDSVSNRYWHILMMFPSNLLFSAATFDLIKSISALSIAYNTVCRVLFTTMHALT
jgi:hypothetical protein